MSQSKRMKNTKIDPLIRDMKNLPKLNVKPNNKKDKIKRRMIQLVWRTFLLRVGLLRKNKAT